MCLPASKINMRAANGTLYSLVIGLSLAGGLRASELPVTDLSRLQAMNVEAEVVTYRGSKALKLTEKAPGKGEALAIVKNLRFRNGSIELEVAGTPAKGAGEGA